MIVFDLVCRASGHKFEGWFGSSDDYASQTARGLLSCPVCGDSHIDKAVMAPAVARKGNQLAADPAPPRRQVTTAAPPVPPEAAALFQAIATAQAEALKSSRWVGAKFAEEARAIHYGEREGGEAIHGQATPAEAEGLAEEGIAVLPVLFPVVPPGEAN